MELWFAFHFTGFLAAELLLPLLTSSAESTRLEEQHF
jgi:hypothetical protein